MTRLYVGNLPSEVTNDGLQQLFSDRGFLVTSARVIRDREGGRSRGFGFVEFASREDAEQVVGELNGISIEGRGLQVKEARPQESHGGRSHSGGAQATAKAGREY